MKASLIILQIFLLAVLASSNTVIKNEEELEEFLRTSKMSRESKQVLREYQREGMLQFPLDPFNFVSQLQSIFSQLPNLFSSIFKFPQFFSPADTRISVGRSDNHHVVDNSNE
ncbi:Protein CBG13335 [Caenorhabditis briggsae]|uniref:Protein CBG13335 n=1 Tax=Caenorhabditis briggsae TaxID=6238 RepID=A8XHM2_CAEBR|nr:Protein CBG13335 [Caenorhabditis briggsae]CAP32274.1 Protein CBG13335 [Caenorhabditis briggsae]